MAKKHKELNKYIDHTILKPDTSKKDIERVCEEALTHGFYAVCVPPYYVSIARTILKENGVKLATVAGFPMGYTTIAAKAEEARRAISDGADEIDMVINIAALKSGNIGHVKEDISNITTLCRMHGKIVKVIFEMGMLTKTEIENLCKICIEAGVDFVKTSTGFFGNGASEEDIKLLRSLLPDKIKIKASGGIRTKESALSLITAGADRIGTSSGLAIIG